MKKIPKAVVVLLFMSTFTIADRNIVLIQEPAVIVAETYEPIPIVGDKNFYAGLGYAYMKMNDDTSSNNITGRAIILLAGYNFHKYIATEGRYFATWDNLNVEDGTTEVDKDWDIANIAIYLKPKYSIDNFTLYGLLDYGQMSLNNHTKYTENGFQWGLGANFAVIDKVNVFVDYARLYDDKDFNDLAMQNDISVDSVNLGVVYNF